MSDQYIFVIHRGHLEQAMQSRRWDQEADQFGKISAHLALAVRQMTEAKRRPRVGGIPIITYPAELRSEQNNLRALLDHFRIDYGIDY